MQEPKAESVYLVPAVSELITKTKGWEPSPECIKYSASEYHLQLNPGYQFSLNIFKTSLLLRIAKFFCSRDNVEEMGLADTQLKKLKGILMHIVSLCSESASNELLSGANQLFVDFLGENNCPDYTIKYCLLIKSIIDEDITEIIKALSRIELGEHSPTNTDLEILTNYEKTYHDVATILNLKLINIEKIAKGQPTLSPELLDIFDGQVIARSYALHYALKSHPTSTRLVMAYLSCITDISIEWLASVYGKKNKTIAIKQQGINKRESFTTKLFLSLIKNICAIDIIFPVIYFDPDLPQIQALANMRKISHFKLKSRNACIFIQKDTNGITQGESKLYKGENLQYMSLAHRIIFAPDINEEEQLRFHSFIYQITCFINSSFCLNRCQKLAPTQTSSIIMEHFSNGGDLLEFDNSGSYIDNCGEPSKDFTRFFTKRVGEQQAPPITSDKLQEAKGI